MFIAISFIALQLCAQKDTTINGKHYQLVNTEKPTVQKKKKIPIDSTFVVNNKKLGFYNNWITIGGGPQQSLTPKTKIGFAGGLDFNFHIKHYYFELGTLLTGENFGFYNNYQFHLGYGKRYENKDIHVAGFAGISYSTGYSKVGDTAYTKLFKQPGLFIQGEIIKKLTYDVGAGFSIFGDWNQEQSLVGVRLVLYFSGAYKGKKYSDGKEE